MLLEGTGNPQEQAGGRSRSLASPVKPSQSSSLTWVLLEELDLCKEKLGNSDSWRVWDGI